MRNNIYKPRTNQIFTQIDKLSNNANTTSPHWYSAGVVQSWTGSAFVEYDRATYIYIYIYVCTHIILYNDVCRTIGPQTMLERGQDNNNAIIRSWVLVCFYRISHPSFLDRRNFSSIETHPKPKKIK